MFLNINFPVVFLESGGIKWNLLKTPRTTRGLWNSYQNQTSTLCEVASLDSYPCLTIKPSTSLNHDMYAEYQHSLKPLRGYISHLIQHLIQAAQAAQPFSGLRPPLQCLEIPPASWLHQGSWTGIGSLEHQRLF